MTGTGTGADTGVITVELVLQQVATTQRRFLRRKFLAGRRQRSVSHAVEQQTTGAGWQQTTVGWQTTTTTGAGQQATGAGLQQRGGAASALDVEKATAARAMMPKTKRFFTGCSFLETGCESG
jgi:hypothetical protein